MLECKNCGHRKTGETPEICPECGFVLHVAEPPRRVRKVETEVRYGDS